jgi:hypothetical protein
MDHPSVSSPGTDSLTVAADITLILLSGESEPRAGSTLVSDWRSCTLGTPGRRLP